MRFNWKKLNRQQVGAYSEYYVKMELTMYEFQVYTPEVDDRGIDFIARYNKMPFLTIQVKSVRLKSNNDSSYVFMEKDKFQLSEDLYLALVILEEEKEPELYLICSTEWENPNNLLVDRNYEGKKSKPEWGVNISNKNKSILEQYDFAVMVENIKNEK